MATLSKNIAKIQLSSKKHKAWHSIERKYNNVGLRMSTSFLVLCWCRMETIFRFYRSIKISVPSWPKEKCAE